MKLDVFNLEKNKVSEIEIDDKIFNINVKDDLIHNVLLAYLNNQHIGSAHTKTRGEVSGGGKKPWRQKGTGRARHGSIRSPLWKGGGITFGPRAHKVRYKVNKIEKKLALNAVLIKKINKNQIIVLDEFKLNGTKTKEAKELLKNFLNEKIRNLLVLEKIDNQTKKVLKNINGLDFCEAKDLNTYNLFINDNVILTKNAMEKIIARLN